MRQYTPKHFRIEELVDRVVFQKYCNRAWQFLDSRILYSIDQIRNKLCKPITINDWLWGGTRVNSGLRSPETTTGAMYSQHKFGRAVDFIVKDMSAIEVRRWLVDNKGKSFLKYITAIERNTPTWTHIDCRNSQFFYFNP